MVPKGIFIDSLGYKDHDEINRVSVQEVMDDLLARNFSSPANWTDVSKEATARIS